MTNNDKPRIPARRGTNSSRVEKNLKANASFQPEYVNDSLQLSGPTNSRRGALSQYTKDLLVYVAALEKETIGLRDKQSTLNEKITELNGTITELERQSTAKDEKHQRELTAAKTSLRTANATMSAERTKADMSEALEDMFHTIHVLFDGAPLSDLSISRGTREGGLVRAIFFACGGLGFAHSISSTRRSLTVWTAVDNPIKLRDYTITNFAGNKLLTDDKAHLLFLREAATVEGYERNKKRLSSTEMDRLYDMERISRTFGCGHSVIQHIQMREELSLRFAPTIVTTVFKRLEGREGTNSHDAELIRAIMITAGMNESTANELARRQARQGAELDKAKAREALRLIQEQSGPLGLHGTIQPIGREVSSRFGVARLSDGFGSDPYGENFLNFAKESTHDLGIDNLFTPCVDGRPTPATEPTHTEMCKIHGHDTQCTHPEHRPKG